MSVKGRGLLAKHLGVILQDGWITCDPQAIVLGGEAVAPGGAACAVHCPLQPS